MERILVVEDESSIRKALKIGLVSKDFEVDVAADGTGGILKSSMKQYSILIADLCLPDIDGLEVIKKVKQNSPEIIPIIITGNASIKSSIEAIHLEVTDYLEKPLTMKLIKDSIAQGIKKRSHKRETMRIKLNHMLNIYMAENKGKQKASETDKDVRLNHLSEKINMIAHQINNPLTAITGSAQLALFDLNDDKSIKEYLINIIEATERIGTVNKEMMQLGRQAEDTTEELNIRTLLENGLLMFKDLLLVKGVQTETDFQSSGLLVKGNPFKMEQVFKNLILNAIDSMDGRPQKFLKVFTTFDEDTLMMSVHIKDTGCGIPEESMDKIFNKKFSNKEHGTGLGLHVVKSFTEEHKGRVKVESVVEEGTTFKISFPVSNFLNLGS